ncbi:FUSC family protein [Photobacterium damselae]|uniref:FUSC family protein n=1 Tax=Photobacterium damselae TaxID=38293 RepID=UPI00406964E8
MISKRWIMPLKVASALTLAIVIALAFGWNKPYWAAFAVIVMAATETNGHSLKKGRLRLLGTCAGVVIAFILVSLFGQQPLAFLVVYSIIIAICIYQQTNPKNGYAWTMGLMVSCVIIVMGKMTSEQTFTIAALRLQETILGVLCFSFVFSIFSPVSSRITLLNTLKNNAETKQDKIEQAICSLQANNTLSKNVSWGDGLKYLARIDDLLQAAKSDSYQVSSEFTVWDSIREQQNQWILLSGHLSEAINLINTPFTQEQKEDLIAILTQLKTRYSNSITLLEYTVEHPHSTIDDLRQYLNNTTAKSSYTFTLESLLDNRDSQHGALRMLAENLLKMDTLQEQMYQKLIQAIINDKPSKAHPKKPTKSSVLTLTFDSERLINVLKILIIFWISVALWVYVPMQGGAMIVMLSLIFGSVALSLPFVSPRYILLHMICWAALALLQYTFILPHLSHLWQLGLFYFINVFSLWFYFNQPQQIFHRLLGCQTLMLMTTSAIQLTPSYNIETSLLTINLLSIALLIIFWIYNGIYSSQPEFVFLRQLAQFRIRLYFKINKLLRKKAHSLISLELSTPVQAVSLAEMASTKINWSTYDDIDKEKITSVLNLAYRVCFHYRAFEDNYHNWKEKQYNESINRLIVESLTELANIMRTSMIHEKMSTTHTSTLSSLQEYLINYRHDESLSALNTVFTVDEINKNYQIVTSLLLFIQSLKDVSMQVSTQQLYQLKLTPFSL